ncbi:MAG: hypothetical protein P8X57_15610 [Cyclobacteriaceae bacterium]
MEIIRRSIRWILITAGILGILSILFIYYANYSTGYRAGVPIKMSKKGTLFKTWEGEMNIGGLTTSADGVIPTTWEFSVRHSQDDVRDEIDLAITHSKRVKLYYKEKFAKLFWLGDTKYFVYKVEEID